MKYFARIDGRQEGPFTLNELLGRQITPDTWVWAKGMSDWQKAEDVPDICRAMRRLLAGLDPVTGIDLRKAQESAGESEEAAGDEMPRYGYIPEPEHTDNFSIPPQGVSVIMALLVTLMCFFPTGIVAVWFAMRTRTLWRMSEGEGLDKEKARELRVKAHASARIYRMMIGISFSLGFIMMGIYVSRIMG